MEVRELQQNAISDIWFYRCCCFNWVESETEVSYCTGVIKACSLAPTIFYSLRSNLEVMRLCSFIMSQVNVYVLWISLKLGFCEWRFQLGIVYISLNHSVRKASHLLQSLDLLVSKTSTLIRGIKRTRRNLALQRLLVLLSADYFWDIWPIIICLLSMKDWRQMTEHYAYWISLLTLSPWLLYMKTNIVSN